MLILCLVTAVAAVLLAVSRPAGPGLRVRLDPPPRPRRVAATRRWLVVVVGLIGAAAVGGAGVWRGGAAASVTAAILIVALTAGWLVVQHHGLQRVLRAQTDVAHACDVLASHLRVGQVATVALDAAARDCPVLERAARIQRIGGDVAEVWTVQAQSPGHGGLRDLARAWRVSESTGSPLSAALEQVAQSLAADQELREVVAGELSAPRATGKVMAILPFLGLGLGYLLGGDPLRWLLAAPIGWGCLVIGFTLAAAGVLWVERLARLSTAQA